MTLAIDQTSFFTFSLSAVENPKFQHVFCSGSESAAKCPSRGSKRSAAAAFSKGVLVFSVTGFVFQRALWSVVEDRHRCSILLVLSASLVLLNAIYANAPTRAFHLVSPITSDPPRPPSPLLQSIDPGQQFTWENSNMEVNKPKNRYANVIAYDHSRVVLTSVDGTNPSTRQSRQSLHMLHRVPFSHGWTITTGQ